MDIYLRMSKYRNKSGDRMIWGSNKKEHRIASIPETHFEELFNGQRRFIKLIVDENVSTPVHTTQIKMNNY